jgi:hypothetical protein
MRHWLLILLIALLPLRGWASGGMATQMAAGQIAIEKIADYAALTRANSPFDAQSAAPTTTHTAPDCHGHASHLRHDAKPGASQADADTSACGACQICHSVALNAAVPVVSPSAIAPWVPPCSRTHFTSADRALGLKPPIS